MDHTSVGLRAAARALSDVVSPAVDPENAQAREQLRLAIDYIEFVLERLDFLHDRELFDLRHHLGMAKAVQGIISPLALTRGAALAAAIERAERTLPEHRTPVLAMRDATAGLAAAIAAVVQEAPRLDDKVRMNIEQCVLQASKERIAFERAWYLPLGLDPDPHEVQELMEVIDDPAT